MMMTPNHLNDNINYHRSVSLRRNFNMKERKNQLLMMNVAGKRDYSLDSIV